MRKRAKKPAATAEETKGTDTPKENGETAKPDGEAPKKKRRPKTAKEPAEESKGEKSATVKKMLGEDGEEKEKPKLEKVAVYVNPCEIVETKTFKSKWEEWRFGDWKKPRPSVYVTLETEIPDMPTDVLKPPDEKAYEAELKALEGKIKGVGKSLEEKKGNFDELLSAKHASQKGGDGQPVTPAIGEKVKRIRELQAQKKAIRARQDAAVAGQE